MINTLLVLGAVKIVATLVSHDGQCRRHLRAEPVHRRHGRRGGRTATHWLAPFPTADPGAYALVGMGALFAGIIRAPLTSVFASSRSRRTIRSSCRSWSRTS
jgi:hypothetical protein